MEIDGALILAIGYPSIAVLVFLVWYFVTGEGEGSFVIAFLWPVALPLCLGMWLCSLPERLPGRCDLIGGKWCKYGGKRNFGDGMPVIETYGFCRKLDEVTFNIKNCTDMNPILKPKKPGRRIGR